MAEDDPYERELIIPFGSTGHVALFETISDHEVLVAAIRHQGESEIEPPK